MSYPPNDNINIYMCCAIDQHPNLYIHIYINNYKPNFSLSSTQKNSLLILKIHEIAIIIYQPRYFEVPKFFKFDTFPKSALANPKFSALFNAINLIEKRQIADDDPIYNKFKEFIVLCFLKYEEEKDFEKSLLQNFKGFVTLHWKTKNLNMVMGNKVIFFSIIFLFFYMGCYIFTYNNAFLLSKAM